RQWLGALTAQWYLHPLYDAVFLPGERQAMFARRLGFHEDQIWRGLYTCDHRRFAEAATDVDRRAFVYVGRLCREKGIDTLIEGYRLYRAAARDPWPLIVSGEGLLRGMFEGVRGIEMTGFVQPSDLPGVLAQ